MKHLITLVSVMLSAFSFGQKIKAQIQLVDTNPNATTRIISINVRQDNVPGAIKATRDSIYFNVELNKNVLTYVSLTVRDSIAAYKMGQTFTAMSDTIISIPFTAPPNRGRRRLD